MIIKHFKTVLILAALCLLVSSSAKAEEYAAGTQKLVLDNGTTIVTKYIPDSTLVTVQVRVLSGLSPWRFEYSPAGSLRACLIGFGAPVWRYLGVTDKSPA